MKVTMNEITIKPKKIFKRKFFLTSNLIRHPKPDIDIEINTTLKKNMSV